MTKTELVKEARLEGRRAALQELQTRVETILPDDCDADEEPKELRHD